MDNVSKFLFEKKFHYSRFQFNLAAILFFTFGILFATYFTTIQLPKIFASSSWTQTDWSGGVGSSTSTQYSAASNTDATTTSGQVLLSTGTEKFSSTGVDASSDLDNWLGVNPTSISGLKFFVKADTGVYTDAGSTAATDSQDIQQWNDQSGNSQNASAPSAGRRPTLHANQVNGRSSLTFIQSADSPSSDDALDATLSSISSISDATYFVVG